MNILSTSTPSKIMLGVFDTTGMSCTTLLTTSISSTSGPFSSSRLEQRMWTRLRSAFRIDSSWIDNGKHLRLFFTSHAFRDNPVAEEHETILWYKARRYESSNRNLGRQPPAI